MCRIVLEICVKSTTAPGTCVLCGAVVHMALFMLLAAVFCVKISRHIF